MSDPFNITLDLCLRCQESSDLMARVKSRTLILSFKILKQTFFVELSKQQNSYSTNTKGFWLELQCWMFLFFTCEPRVCFYPLCSSPKFLRPVITQNNFTWLPSFSKPVSSGHFLDLDRSPPQCTIHAPPYKPGYQHERWKGWREGFFSIELHQVFKLYLIHKPPQLSFSLSPPIQSLQLFPS